MLYKGKWIDRRNIFEYLFNYLFIDIANSDVIILQGLQPCVNKVYVISYQH